MRSHHISLISTLICNLVRQKDEKPMALISGHLDHSKYAARSVSGGRIPVLSHSNQRLTRHTHLHTLFMSHLRPILFNMFFKCKCSDGKANPSVHL